MIIDQQVLDELTARAKASPRLQMKTASFVHIEIEVAILIIATSRKTVCGF